jgi:subtilisin family serine protease
MKSIFVRSILVAAFLLGTFSMRNAAAGNLFQGESSTAGGYSTWDSDMINIESVSETGSEVYIAVVDTGLAPNWRDYFPEERVDVSLGTGFDQAIAFKVSQDDPCKLGVEVGPLRQTTWVGSVSSTHGTHVASTILGYFYQSPQDALAGFPLPGIIVRGIAPEVTIIPVKVLNDYQIPATPQCPEPQPATLENFGTWGTVAAGINYVTDLAIAGYSPMVINMSLGGDEMEQVVQDAIDRAIANGVIIVASAGNNGEVGMGYPGAYPPVISAGSNGWTGEWLYPGDGPRYRMWWLQYTGANMPAGSGDVADPTSVEDVYLSDFSSRALAGQELDVLAPGSWVRGPFPGFPGFSHLPWWSRGLGGVVGGNPGNFYYVGGTSMSAPHVASAAALMLQKDPTLNQSQIESFLKSTALPMPGTGSRNVYDFSAWATISWDIDCDGAPCDPVGAGVLQVDAAIAAVP